MSWKSKRNQRSFLTQVIITSAKDHTTINKDGSVKSVQKAVIELPKNQLDQMWQNQYLERLARTYWRYLSRCTLGFVRVVYTPAERYVVFLHRWLPLLTFRQPEYITSAAHGCVRWRIQRGLLVAPAGHHGDGYLQIDVRQLEDQRSEGHTSVEVSVEVANFYPTIAKRLTTWFYLQTQARIHVIVTHGFLRSLQKLNLAESKAGTFTSESV